MNQWIRPRVQPNHQNIEIIRTDRKKTASLRLRDGQMQLVVPKRATQGAIDRILAAKANWIRKTLAEDAARSTFEPCAYTDGSTFTWLGRKTTLAVSQEANGWPSLQDDQISLGTGSPNETRAQLLAWAKQEAHNHLRARVQQYSDHMNVRPGPLTVRDYKSRWGSCSADGSIRFNWRIMIAPPDIVDYVVVHELAHLREMNHSPRFWAHVKAVLPDLDQHRQWLKQNGYRLRFD